MDGRTRRGLHAAVVAYTIWGLLTLYWKRLDDLDAVEMIGWRVGTAAVLMVLVVAASGRWRPVATALRTPGTASRIVLASLLLAANWTTYVWAVVNDRVLETALGYFLAPLGTMALGVWVLGERLTPAKRASIAFAVAAVIAVGASYDRLPWVALLLAVSWSWYGLTKRRVPLGPVESLTAEVVVLMVPAVLLAGSGFVRDGGIPDQAGGADWAWLLGTGAITAAPLLLFAFAAKRVPFTLLGPANYLVPIINFLLGWLVFDETLDTARVVGFTLVWIALVLVTVETLSGDRERPSVSTPVR